MMQATRFLDIDDLAPTELRGVIDTAHAIKQDPRRVAGALAGKAVAVIFHKPSTRTRVSFEVGIAQLGATPVILSANEMQLGRGESIADTARVLSRYVDAIVVRTGAHENLVALAQHASVPVINALTDRSHPCQILADVQAIEERSGPIAGQTVAWLGDTNNVCFSLAQAALSLGFSLRVAYPPELAQARQDAALVSLAEGVPATRLLLSHDPAQAVAGADAVVTDTWVSMGEPDDAKASKRAMLQPYRVDEALMAQAASHALFLHCLPAYRGDEVTAGVIDGPRSAVWDEAENRLHAQKALLLHLMR